MKEFKDKLLAFFAALIAVLLTPLFLLTVLIEILIGLIRYPFCNAKYKKSHYFKDFGIKYAAFVYDSDFYTVYNAVKEANLPLKPVLCRDHKNRVVDLLFFHGDTLLCINFGEKIEYDTDTGKWTVEIFNDEIDGDETVDFIEYTNKQTSSFLSQHLECPLPDRRMILVQSKHIAKENLPCAMETPEFLVYEKKNVAEVIRKFINEN